MEEKIVMEKNTAVEYANNEQGSSVRLKKQKDEFHEMKCKVIYYDKRNKTLDIMFDKYGIRMKNVEAFDGAYVTVKYKGEIGKPNFKVLL